MLDAVLSTSCRSVSSVLLGTMNIGEHKGLPRRSSISSLAFPSSGRPVDLDRGGGQKGPGGDIFYAPLVFHAPAP